MNRAFVAVLLLLIASLIANAVLLLRSEPAPGPASAATAAAAPAETRAPAPDLSSARTPVAEDHASLAARIAELEDQLAQAEKDRATLRSIDPLAVAVYSTLPLRDKLLAILALGDEKKVGDAIGKLAELLARDPANRRMLLDLLADENDPSVLAALEQLDLAAALGKLEPEMVEGVFAVATGGEPAARRRVALAALYEQGRHMRGDAAFVRRINDVLKQEHDPEVVAYALQFFDWNPGAVDVDWLTTLVGTSQDPTVRSRAAIAASRSMRTKLDQLFDTIDSAPTEEVRSAWMDGLGRTMNSGTGTPIKDLDRRLLSVLQHEPRLRTRQDVLRGSMFAMMQGGDWLEFLRKYQPLEPNAEQQRAIGEVIALVESGKSSSHEIDPILRRAR